MTDTATTAPAPTDIEQATARRNRLVITLLLISGFVVILNETIMGVAIPNLMDDLGITAGAAQWLTTAFLLTMAVVIPITGFLLQRFHTRSVFIAAMTLFSAGTAIAAIAPGFEVLLLARVVQASGTAIMMPLLFTTVLNLVPPARRGAIMGNISIVISVAPALGPTISGIILNYLDWRWMFILVLPIAIASLVLGVTFMKNVTEPRPGRFDVLSVILSALGFGGLIFGLSNIGEAGIAAMASWMPLLVGAAALTAFVLRQRFLARTDDALLDLRTFSNANFRLSIILIAFAMMTMFGTIILLPIYMQRVLELDALTTGLMLLPGGLAMGLLAPFVGRIFDRHGPRALLVVGSVVISAVLWGMTMLDENTETWWIVIAHVSLSIGLALMFTPLFTAGLSSLAPALYSHGSAIVGTTQQVAGAAGTALFITVMSAQSAGLIAGGTAAIPAMAAGIHTAFVYGAVLSLALIPLAFLVKRPPAAADGAEFAAH